MKWRVSKEDAGITLLTFLKTHYPEASSVKSLKRAIDQKYCLVNGTIQTFSSTCLSEGDVVVLNPAAFEVKQPLVVTTLYEDADLLVIHKPSVLLSTIQDLKQRGCHLVHRLDKETSGALLLAKTTSAKQSLMKLFKERKVRKLYLAIVDGMVEKEEGTIDNHLGLKGQLS